MLEHTWKTPCLSWLILEMSFCVVGYGTLVFLHCSMLEGIGPKFDYSNNRNRQISQFAVIPFTFKALYRELSFNVLPHLYNTGV